MPETPCDGTRTIPITATFPTMHMQAFGTGKVGTIHITLTPEDEIIQAEAEVYYAPFKRMIIDDPKILRIFGHRGEEIKPDILHPWPKLQLVPFHPISDTEDDLDMQCFEVGRLIDVTHVSAATQMATARAQPGSWKDGAVYKSIEKSVKKAEAEARRRQRRLKPFAYYNPLLTLSEARLDSRAREFGRNAGAAGRRSARQKAATRARLANMLKQGSRPSLDRETNDRSQQNLPTQMNQLFVRAENDGPVSISATKPIDSAVATEARIREEGEDTASGDTQKRPVKLTLKLRLR